METPKALARILCPVDFSDSCQRALELAVALARRDEAEVTALHVYVPPPPQPELLPTLVPPFEELRPKLLSELRAFVEPVSEGVAFTLGLTSGDPAREIVQTASSAGADLIVIGTHHRRGLERWLLGSTAELVMRRATCPVLTACQSGGRPAAEGFAHVLCAVDLYPSSRHTLQAAASFAREDGELTVMHVVEGPSDQTLGVLGHMDVPEYRRQLEAEARQRLHETVAGALHEGRRVDELVASGRAYRQILRVASERSTDLIVMGIHGAGPVDRLFFGSTALQVVRAAGCAVLTLR